MLRGGAAYTGEALAAHHEVYGMLELQWSSGKPLNGKSTITLSMRRHTVSVRGNRAYRGKL